MNTPSQTTEFSAHLSWAGMRRYLQEALSAEKSQRVERHLHHCPRCSSAILDYIQAEEPEHYKQYTKKLKGIIATGQAEKKNVLSSFQMKAIRTSTAVIALLIFSFFAIKTVINKQADYPLPSESLAVAEKSEKSTPVRRRPVKKVAQKPTITKEEPQKPAEVVKKITRVTRQETPAAKAPTVVTKTRATTPPKSPAPAAEAPEQQASLQGDSQPQVKNEDSTSATQEETPTQEEVAEAPAQETTSRKPLPTLQKLDATQGAESVTPIGKSSPAEMPMPSNQILER